MVVLFRLAGVVMMAKLNPQELADRLKRSDQVAGGMFGLLYADHMETGHFERSPNARKENSSLTKRRRWPEHQARRMFGGSHRRARMMGYPPGARWPHTIRGARRLTAAGSARQRRRLGCRTQ